MSKQTILVIDDEPDIRELLDITLSRMGHHCQCAESFNDAIEHLNKNRFSLCLTDMNLGEDKNGLDIIAYIQENQPELPVAMITAYGNTETAIEAMKAGAFDYVAKPIDLPKLRALITAGLKVEGSDKEKADPANQLLGESQQMQSLRSKIAKLAKSLAPVFINGESGSGKELVARMIHQLGPRSSQPFIAVNCGAIPFELMESEFFGHEKGSFTGANEKKIGLFQAANGGTLFLDEIADLPKDMQVKLLRAIQEKSIRPVGATQEIVTDVRILSATHKNLADEVSENRFRQDLFYRLNVIEVAVPSLRERIEDISLLSTHILKKLASRYEMETAKLDSSALKKLQRHNFPGNVRELENILERAFTLCDQGSIGADDLDVNTTAVAPSQGSNTGSGELNYAEALGDMEGFLESIEKDILEYALEQTRWNKTAAAELLGISFRTMRYKLKKLEIN
jgi:two-component system response regulator PilR (NtrC family)